MGKSERTLEFQIIVVTICFFLHVDFLFIDLYIKHDEYNIVNFK